MAVDGEGLCEGLLFLILVGQPFSAACTLCPPGPTVALGLDWALLHTPGLRQPLAQSGYSGNIREFPAW